MSVSTLEKALSYEHLMIRELAMPAHRSNAGAPDRRHETDWFYAITAQHLAAAEDVLLPRIRDLDDGKSKVTAYVENARLLEKNLRRLKGRIYGDGRAQHFRKTELWQRIDELMDDHERIETEYGAMLSAELDGPDISDLTERLLTAEEHAPTRAHPVSPHTGLAGRMAHRAWRLADRTWDAAEGRVVPTHYHRHPKHDSAWSVYLRGDMMPGAEEAAEKEAADQAETEPRQS
ncbi:hypothetical protein OG394_21125 [Kribbella sp. NBC_01245]|uniref:hypothetical protein n=1 Tax=Kribbella sp. NBC_01245 TaxID=2903578 RepID=UPI002E2B24B4|nr:hypothetical protein [Kribbella sp. NBC_01245]